MKRKYYVIWGIVVAVVLGLMLWKYSSQKTPLPTETPVSTSTIFKLTDDISLELSEGVTATLLPISNETIQPPSLPEQIVIDSSIHLDAAERYRERQQEIIVQLKKEPNRVDLWLALGVYQKASLDYKGAEESWLYVAQTAPTDLSAIAHGNLGDLYQNFLKDYPKAETSYLQAIALRPNHIDYYRNLFTLYRYQYKVGTGADTAILKQGLTANPKNPELLELGRD